MRAELLGAPAEHRSEYAYVVTTDREHAPVEVLTLPLNRRGVPGQHRCIRMLQLIETHEVQRHRLMSLTLGLRKIDLDLSPAPRQHLTRSPAVRLRQPHPPPYE